MSKTSIKHVEELESQRDVSISTSTIKEEKPSVPSGDLAVEHEGPPHVHLKTILVVITINCIYFTQLINVVGAGAYARAIAAVVGGSQNSVWLASAVTILTVVLSPPISQAADYWGRKWFLVGLTACGFVGCIVVSRATSMPMVIAGEVIAGLSYGAQPLLHAVSSEVLPRKWRPYAQASVNVAASLGGFTGLMVGETLTRNGHAEGFRTYWYIAAGLYAGATLSCFFLYNPPLRELQKTLTFAQKIRQLDWIGYVLLASGLVLFCIGLSWSQNPYPWTSANVLATFLTGCALSIALIVYETWVKKDGMFHHELFSRGFNFPISLGCVFVEGLVFFAANNYFAFQLSVLYETDAVMIGLRYGLTFLVYAFASILAGVYCSKTKMCKVPIIVAFCSFLIFNILMATANSGSSKAVWGYVVFLGIGLGVCLCALVVAAQLATPPELISITSGLMISVRSLGGSVGLAIYNAIFSSSLKTNLGPKIAAAAISSGLPASSVPQLIGDLASQNTTDIATIPGINGTIIGNSVQALRDAYVIAFRHVWIAAGSFTVIAIVASIFLKDHQESFTSQIDAPAETEEELYRD